MIHQEHLHLTALGGGSSIGASCYLLYPAGHLPGACMFHIRAPGGSLLYSGDFTWREQWTVPGCVLPKLAGQVDVLLMESTYADRVGEHEAPGLAAPKRWDTVFRVLERGGRVLLPSFAVGRDQETVRAKSIRSLLQRIRPLREALEQGAEGTGRFCPPQWRIHH